MNEFLHYQGTSYQKMEQLFLQYLDKEQVIDFLQLFCEHNPSMFDEDETYQQNTGDVNTESYNKLVSTTTYFVNVKKITLLLFSLICEAGFQSLLHGKPVTGEVVSIVPALAELKNSLVKLQEDNGEFCIATECSRKNSAIRNYSDFRKPHNECCNNHFQCRFNDDGICRMSESDFIKAVEKMEQYNVLIRKDDLLKVQF